MKINYILFFLLFTTLSTFSQNKKISIEVNYPLAISKGIDVTNKLVVSNDGLVLSKEIENLTGIADVSIKYRFTRRKLYSFGASITYDLLKGQRSLLNPITITQGFLFPSIEYNSIYNFCHINGFTEINIPSAANLHPFVGAGFTFTNYYFEFKEVDTPFETGNEQQYGFNLELGIQYDFISGFFIQSYFHLIKSFDKSKINNQTSRVNYNLLKFGLGYRF